MIDPFDDGSWERHIFPMPNWVPGVVAFGLTLTFLVECCW